MNYLQDSCKLSSRVMHALLRSCETTCKSFCRKYSFLPLGMINPTLAFLANFEIYLKIFQTTKVTEKIPNTILLLSFWLQTNDFEVNSENHSLKSSILQRGVKSLLPILVLVNAFSHLKTVIFLNGNIFQLKFNTISRGLMVYLINRNVPRNNFI